MGRGCLLERGCLVEREDLLRGDTQYGGGYQVSKCLKISCRDDKLL